MGAAREKPGRSSVVAVSHATKSKLAPFVPEALLESLPAGVYVCATDGTIGWANRRAIALWGRAPAPAETDERFGAAWMVRADGRAIPYAETPIARALRTGETVRDFEAVIARPDGTRVDVLINAEPLRDASDALSGAIACFVDISARKRAEVAARDSERRLRATYERSFAGIAETGLDGRFMHVSPRFCELTGHGPEELIGRNVLDVTHPEDIAAERENFERLIAGEIDHYQLEKRYFRKGGELGWAAVSVALVPGTPERPPYVIRVALDLSDRKQAEVRQRMLLAEVNHRVKNSLAAVKAIADQTHRSVGAPEQFYEAFSSRLLAFSRAHDLLNRDAWRGALLSDILSETLAPFGVADGRIRFDFADAAGTLRFAPAAALALGMVCHELATNAVKYGALTAPEGTVQVHCAVTLEKPPRVRIEWIEVGGPPVSAPLRQGFGTRFIQRTLASQFDGAAEADFAPDGMRYQLVFPLSLKVVAQDPPVEN